MIKNLFPKLLYVIILILTGSSISAQENPISGWFSIIYHDSQDSSYTTYLITTDSGETYELQLSPAVLNAPGGVLALNTKHVTITFEPSAQRNLRLAQSIIPDSVQPPVTGGTTWANILCKFSDNASSPTTDTAIDGLFNNTFPLAGHFWAASSYGQMTITTADTFNWMTLPHTRAYYLAIGGWPMAEAMLDDCAAQFAPSVNFDSYYGINVFLNGEMDGYSRGGTSCRTLDGINKCWHFTMLAASHYIGRNDVLPHEMGHALGLPHSNNSDNDLEAHDNYWDLMSSSWQYCEKDVTYGCIGADTNAYNKDTLGWIPAARKFTAPTGSSTITLDRLAAPSSSNYYTAVIPVDATHWFMLEARRDTDGGYDNSLPGSGVLIYSIDTARPEPAWLVGAISDRNTGNGTPAWLPGETYTNYANGFSVAVNAATVDGYQVTILRGSLPGTAPKLAVTITDGVDPATNTVTYTVQLQNTGGTATGVVLAADFPSNLALKSISSPGDICIESSAWNMGRGFHCKIGTMSASTFTATIVAGAAANTTTQFTANVFADQTDANPANDTDVETTTFTATGTDMAVHITDNPDPVALNQQITYNVKVRNEGSPANNVAFSMVLDSSLTALSYSGTANTPFSCSMNSHTLTCNGSSLTMPGMLDLTVKGTATTLGTVTTTASVTQTEADINPASNSATILTTVLLTVPTSTPEPATPTSTPIVPTATATLLPAGSLEVLANGGFEIAGLTEAQAQNWKLQFKSGDKRKCNTDLSMVSFRGNCAFLFKGNVLEAAKLSQTPLLDPFNLTAGDTLAFSVEYKTGATAPRLKLKVVTIYTDTTVDSKKFTISEVSSNVYKLYTIPSMTVTGTVQKIKVQFHNRATAGKIYLDDASLIFTDNTP